MELKILQVITKQYIVKRLKAAHKTQREGDDKMTKGGWRLSEPSCRR